MTDSTKNNSTSYKAPRGVLPILRENFIKPRQISWSYTFFLFSFGILIALILIKLLKNSNFSSTSLVGYALISPIFCVFAYILPAIIAGTKIKSDTWTDNTGIGSLIMAFVSGVPLALVFRTIHNLSAYFHLWSGRTTIFPALFYYCDDTTLLSRITEVLSGCIIPAIGVAILLYGIMWDRISRRGFYYALCIISVVYALAQLNPIDFFSYLFVGAWMCILRDRIGNAWSIVLCLLSMKLTSILTLDIIREIDIYSTQTLSDVDDSFIYSTLPALFFGIILLLLVRRYLNEFKDLYFTSSMADNLDTKNQELYSELPSMPLVCYLPALITGVIIFITIWTILFKGGFL